MARFLSDEWVAELGDALAAGEDLAEATTGTHLTVQQVVTGDDGGAWWVRVDGGQVRAGTGRAEDPDVTMTTDRPTAVALAQGHLAAQDAFAAGRLRLGGDITVIIRHGEALACVDDAVAAVRARTTWD
ncbi:MAG TPA: SCP2 sterol-binding domain-containing protein [Acidimicrobiales bacterium]|nr:SCP2 sterol-binding domain-containing protein [Acidimicrobiales bacterium]